MTEYHACLNEKLINWLSLVTSSSQYCSIDDSQDREGTIFISYSLAVQLVQKHSDFQVLFAAASFYFQSQCLQLPVFYIIWNYPYLEIRMWLNISFAWFDDHMSDLITVISYRQTLDLNSHRLSSY